MCMQMTGVRPYQRWRWAGDEIAHDPILPAMRRVPVRGGKRFDIDVREFLSFDDNAVIRRALEKLRSGLAPEEQARFAARTPGAFDFRKRTVVQFVDRLRYIPSERRFDSWLFPDETIARGGGDCEDRAFLLAALLEASGISGYCVRVAFGVVVERMAGGEERRFDHVWVVYFGENGAWEILEPLALRPRRRRKASDGRRRPPLRRRSKDLEYIPYYVLNRDHLWRVRSAEPVAAGRFSNYVQSRSFWRAYDPSFALDVHESIYDQALIGMSEPDLDDVKSASTGVDVDVLNYDPRDHFDFAYVDPGWDRVQARLATGQLEDFALATHAIADFYAHSMYGVVATPRSDGSLPLYDPSRPLPAESLVYHFGTSELPGCSTSRQQAEAYWNGRLISGQWWRWYTTFPDDLQAHAADLARRRCLPDHDQVAVDHPQGWAPGHLLTEAEYREQFSLRNAAAIEHIREVYREWKTT
jgi:hypothetical protein